MAQEFDITIIGGGHSGLFLARALADQGWRLALVEPRPIGTAPATADGRNLALMRSSREAADRFGIWPALAPVVRPVEAVHLREKPGGATLVTTMRELGGRPFAYGVEHPALHAALATSLAELGEPPRIFANGLRGLERRPEARLLELADGSRIATRLVIGADGRGSRLRELAGIRLDAWRYDQAAISFIVAHTRPHRQTVHEWMRPRGPLALLPLPGRRSGVTWVEPEDRARALVAEGEEALLRRLGEESEGVLGDLRLASRIGIQPLGAQHARRYVAPRLALIGDAAHGVHPIHAQGFNMAVADIAELAEALARAARRGEDPGGADLLLGYERARWWANQQRIWMTDGLNRIFSSEAAWLQPVRSGAIRAVAALPPLRRRLARNRMQLV